jgi:hypothetical protein
MRKVLNVFSTGQNISIERGTTLRMGNGANMSFGIRREFIGFVSFISFIGFSRLTGPPDSSIAVL